MRGCVCHGPLREDSTVTGYQILRQRPYECEPTLMVHVDDTGTTATTFIDPDLDRNVRYTYRVKAINGDKISSWSNFATSQYFAPKHVKKFGTPSAPHSLDSVSTVGGIELTWEPPNGEEGITGYQILRKRPEECETSMRVHVENTGSTSTTLMDEDVEVGTKYVYSVAAINANGHGEWSIYASSRQGNGQVVMMSAQDFLTIAPGTKTSFSVSASHLPRDNDPDTVDYILRGDVTDTESGEAVDSCEDNNLGTDIEITVVDSVSVQYGGTFGGPGCMAGDYKVHFVVTDADKNEKLAGTLFYYKVTSNLDEGSFLPNNPATGAPTISGTAQVDETLTADTSGIADADGLSGVTYNYQWLSSRDTEIQGATDATYILQASDEGKTIKVRVSFTDDAGNEETLTSAATEAVTSVVNNPATGLPVIRGTAQVGETLTADTSDIPDSDGLDNASFSYQWVRNDGTDDADIQGATASTYTPSDEDVGKTIKVRVSFADEADNEETLTSAATAAVGATVPGMPKHLNVSPHDAGALDLHWAAPTSDGGSPITGYKVQWKEAADSWDIPEEVAEETATGNLPHPHRADRRCRVHHPGHSQQLGRRRLGLRCSWGRRRRSRIPEYGQRLSRWGSKTNMPAIPTSPVLGPSLRPIFSVDDANYTVRLIVHSDDKLYLGLNKKMTAGFVLRGGCRRVRLGRRLAGEKRRRLPVRVGPAAVELVRGGQGGGWPDAFGRFAPDGTG